MSDLIERDKAINILDVIDVDIIPYADTRKYVQIAIDYIRKELGDIPSARPKGEWIRGKDGRYFCDKCGCVCGRYSNHSDPLHGNRWNYYFCPNCGADMRGDKNGNQI